MKLKVTKTHNITFAVECFENQEGGMLHETFREDVQTLEEAVTALELAHAHDQRREWIITANVTTTIASA